MLYGQRVENEKYVRNYLNFRVENFRVQEEGTLENIIRQDRQPINIQPNNEGNRGMDVFMNTVATTT